MIEEEVAVWQPFLNEIKIINRFIYLENSE